MVNCCVPGCTNYSPKTEDVTYHRIPSDKQRRKAWLDRIRRSNMPQVQYSYVCSDHFLPSCYELNLRSQITTQKCKRRLKEDAIPSELSILQRPKSLDCQAKIARIDEGIRKLVVYFVFCIAISFFFAKVPSHKKITLGYLSD